MSQKIVYIFRQPADRELWRKAQERTVALNLRFKDVVENLLREWLSRTTGAQHDDKR